VLRPVIEEIGEKSPLYPALAAPESARPIKTAEAGRIEFCVREADGALFLLACSRGNETALVTFSGLPEGNSEAVVMFEPPRTVAVMNGTLQDWFAPFEVHVYRLSGERPAELRTATN
jgi:hypothetical protein